MPTALNFEIEQTDNAKILIFRDTTGAYDDPNNLTGWGVPNEDLGDVISTSLTITPPGNFPESTYTSTSYPNWGGLGSFPTTDPNLELEITSEMLGQNANIEHLDGVWTIKYTVTTSTTIYTKEHKVFISGSIRCCVYKKLAAIDTVDCDCDSTEKKYALEAFTFYRSLIANAACGNESKYNELLELTNKLCSTNKC